MLCRDMKRLAIVALAVLWTAVGAHAQVPAEVTEVMRKCGKAMSNPAGMEFDMDMTVSVAIVSFKSKLVTATRGEKNRQVMTAKVMGHEVVTESCSDGVQEWTYVHTGEGSDTIHIGKASGEKKRDGDIDLGMADEFKKATMKLKDGYYVIDFSKPVDKSSEIKSMTVKVSAKNYVLREMKTSVKGARVTMTINKIKVGLNDDYFKFDPGKYPNAVVVRD